VARTVSLALPVPDLLVKALESTSDVVALCVRGTAIGFPVFWLAICAPFDRVLHAIREDKLVATATG
jgi:hypothetical protein